MLKKYIFLFVIVWVYGYSFSQSFNYGLPLLNNYGAQDYQANNDNWAIEQDGRGIMYFGNSGGLLEFDGHHWKNFAPGVFAYDMKKSPNGVIYVATDNDFGYIGYKENGETEYVSLLQSELKENEYVGTFYTVEIVDGIVYFLANRGFLFKWDNKKLERISLPHPKTSRYKTLRYLNNRFYIQSPDGLAELLNDSIPKILPQGEYFKNISVEEIFEIGDDSLMLLTRLHGLFLYSNNQLRPMNSDGSEFAKKNQVYAADRIDDDNFVLGTIQKGVLVIDKAGNIRYNVNREAGMISNDHCEIFIDKNKNIWSALENGITNISRNSPFSQIPEQYNIPLAKVYSMKIHNNNFYVGTAQGTYYANMNRPEVNRLRFGYVEGTGARKILDIIEIENEYILTASGTGVFLANQNKADQITKRTFQDLEVFDKNHIIGALFKGGIGVLKKKNNSWYLHKIFTNYPVLSYLNVDRNRQLWFIEDEKRMIRAELNEKFDNIVSYEEVTGIPENISFDSVSIFQINDQILMGTKNGTYRLVNNNFEPYTELNEAFGVPVFIDEIKCDRLQKTWFIGRLQDDVVIGKIDINADGSVAVKQFKTTLHRLDDYTISTFYPYDDENVFIGTSERIIHFNSSYNHIADNQFPVYIRSVEIINSKDAVLFGGVYKDENKIVLNQPKKNIPNLKFENNALRFTYAGIFYDEPKNTTFQYKLEGYDDTWSDWTSITTKEYNFLREGDYQFNVRAKNAYGIASDIDSYRFSIVPPWYRTILAYVIYLALLVLLVHELISYRTRRLKRENIRLENIVVERTEEILSQKEEIEDQNQVLSNKNKEISQQTEQLKESNQIKNQLFSIISHDLRSPMLSLISWVEMVKDQTISEAVFREHIDKLSERLGHTREVTENLLNWANSQMKGYKINKESFVINELVVDKIIFFKDQTGNKGIKVLDEVPNKLEIYADRDMIDLVLRNTMANAIKFSKPGDSITINATVSEQNVVVSIEDTGVGIAPENISKLFGKEFYTTFGTQEEHGSGLGLMLCKDFVELNGGKIWVESTKGEGSTFYFSIPVE